MQTAAVDAFHHRLADIRIIGEPYPHVAVENFLPPEIYARLATAWPSDSSFRASKNRQKLDMVPSETHTDAYSAAFVALPPDVKAVWREFVTFNRSVVGPWLVSLFAGHIRERVALLQRLTAEGRTGLTASGLESGTVQANAGRLMMRGHGYKLAPHIDPAYYVVTVLHYFAEGDDDGYGTRLFKARSPIPLDAFVKDGTTEYFETHGIPVTEAARLPFRANGFLAFPNLLDAAHGVDAPSSGYRKVFQYHLSLKGDFEPL
jgi:hypothetical protein